MAEPAPVSSFIPSDKDKSIAFLQWLKSQVQKDAIYINDNMEAYDAIDYAVGAIIKAHLYETLLQKTPKAHL